MIDITKISSRGYTASFNDRKVAEVRTIDLPRIEIFDPDGKSIQPHCWPSLRDGAASRVQELEGRVAKVAKKMPFPEGINAVSPGSKGKGPDLGAGHAFPRRDPASEKLWAVCFESSCFAEAEFRRHFSTEAGDSGVPVGSDDGIEAEREAARVKLAKWLSLRSYETSSDITGGAGSGDGGVPVGSDDGIEAEREAAEVELAIKVSLRSYEASSDIADGSGSGDGESRIEAALRGSSSPEASGGDVDKSIVEEVLKTKENDPAKALEMVEALPKGATKEHLLELLRFLDEIRPD